MDTNVVSILTSIIVIAIMLIVVIWFIISLVVLYKLRNKFNKDSKILEDMKESNKHKMVEYSTQVLEFIRMMVGQVAVLKFRTFVDSNDLSKVSKSSVEKLVADVAASVNNSMNMVNLSLENTVYSKEFFEQYIIETSVLMVKDLLDKAIGDKDEE